MQAIVGSQYGTGPGQHLLAGGGKTFEALAAIDQMQVEFLPGCCASAWTGWLSGIWQRAALRPKCRVSSRAMRNFSCLMSIVAPGAIQWAILACLLCSMMVYAHGSGYFNLRSVMNEHFQLCERSR